jgi:hypothetical protein
MYTTVEHVQCTYHRLINSNNKIIHLKIYCSEDCSGPTCPGTYLSYCVEKIIDQGIELPEAKPSSRRTEQRRKFNPASWYPTNVRIDNHQAIRPKNLFGHNWASNIW